MFPQDKKEAEQHQKKIHEITKEVFRTLPYTFYLKRGMIMEILKPQGDIAKDLVMVVHTTPYYTTLMSMDTHTTKLRTAHLSKYYRKADIDIGLEEILDIMALKDTQSTFLVSSFGQFLTFLKSPADGALAGQFDLKTYDIHWEKMKPLYRQPMEVISFLHDVICRKVKLKNIK